MAAVATVTKKLPLTATENMYIGTIAWDSTYPAGGEVISITGCERIEHLSATGSGYVGEWLQASQKLKLYYGNYDAADGPLIENATADISAVTAMPFVAVGA